MVSGCFDESAFWNRCVLRSISAYYSEKTARIYRSCSGALSGKG